MNISELVAAFNKVSQVAGDVPVILKDTDTGAETYVHALVLSFDPETGSTDSMVVLAHGPAVTPPPPPSPPPAAA